MRRWPLWLCIPVVLLLGSGAALAQGGTGGSLGQTNKSVSGGQPESAPAPHRQAAPRPSRSAPARSARVETGAVGSMAGAWAGMSTGSCIPNWTWTIQISSDGNMSGSGVTGQVSRGGTAMGTMTVGGTSYNFVGHVSGRAASGTWTTAAGCSGRWTAAKN
jgi:hypothetical protein